MIALWIAVGGSRFEKYQDNVVVERASQVVGFWGGAALIAGISFVAYLAGSLLIVGSSGRISRLITEALGHQPLETVLRWFRVTAEFGAGQSRTLVDWSESASRRIRATGIGTAELLSESQDLPSGFVRRLSSVFTSSNHAVAIDGDVTDQHAKLLSAALRDYVMVDEFESLAVRLQIERELIYDAYDRLSTEAELRFSISPPIVVAVSATAILWSPWALLALVVPAALLFQGAVLVERARQRVIQALSSNVIDSPVVQTLCLRGELPLHAQQAIEQRESQAAEACFAALAGLEETIPRYSSFRRSDGDPEDEAIVRAEHDKLLGQLEANIVLLKSEHRVEMAGLLGVLRYAYDLPSDLRNGKGWHPDTAAQIAKHCASYGREVLAAQLRRQAVPDLPPVMAEYLLANGDRNDDLGADFAQEIGERDQEIASWRVHHGLPPSR